MPNKHVICYILKEHIYNDKEKPTRWKWFTTFGFTSKKSSKQPLPYSFHSNLEIFIPLFIISQV